jgi:hypothetical protein
MDLTILLARAEITDVLTAYVHGADRADWDLVRRCYHPDAIDDHGLYAGNVAGLLAFLSEVAATLSATSHQLGPPHIEVDGDTARAETYCLGRYERPGHDTMVWSIAQGLRYLDLFERRQERWAIAHRIVVLDWEQVLAPGPPSVPAPTWQHGARGAADPSFTFFTNPLRGDSHFKNE